MKCFPFFECVAVAGAEADSASEWANQSIIVLQIALCTVYCTDLNILIICGDGEELLTDPGHHGLSVDS